MKSILIALALCLAGCTNYTPSNRDVGAATGAALGAGLGAIVGNQVGNAGEGVAVGAAAGGLVGGLLGHSQDLQNTRVESQEEVLRRQEQELRRQQRELEDLKRQRYQDGTIGSYSKPDTDRYDRSARAERPAGRPPADESYGSATSPGAAAEPQDPYTYSAEPEKSSAGGTYSTGTEYGSTGDRDDYRY